MMIDNADQWRLEARQRRPVEVTSRTNGKVAVPCMQTVLAKRELVCANRYNPNSVPDDKMGLLRESILDNGFCFPIVTIFDDETGTFIIIDGFHRNLIGGGEWLDLDYVPIVVLDHDVTKRLAATMQFNKARGTHQVDLDAEVIRALIEAGTEEEVVATKLGIDLETVHRYKQVTGVASLFARSEYSLAWEMDDDA